MSERHWLWIGSFLAAVLASSVATAVEEIAEHRQKQIREAVPEKPRVEPAESRRVLVFNTPNHLYDKDPHRGYCVPYGSYAMKALGEKSGAYKFRKHGTDKEAVEQVLRKSLLDYVFGSSTSVGSFEVLGFSTITRVRPPGR